MTPIGRAIAIVDDDAAVCDSTSFLLETYDFVVLTYLRGADFLKDDPDIACLIVDYQMPGMNGLELVTALRKRGSKVPVIMISAAPGATPASAGSRTHHPPRLGKAPVQPCAARRDPPRIAIARYFR
jgi:CheY-like chemotaxis protein